MTKEQLTHLRQLHSRNGGNITVMKLLDHISAIEADKNGYKLRLDQFKKSAESIILDEIDDKKLTTNYLKPINAALDKIRSL